MAKEHEESQGQRAWQAIAALARRELRRLARNLGEMDAEEAAQAVATLRSALRLDIEAAAFDHRVGLELARATAPDGLGDSL